MKNALKAVAVIALVFGAVYVGLFSYWWLTAKRTVAVVSGQRQVVIIVHETDLMHHTEPIWKPAFWFMERVGGFRYAGYIAAMEDSAFVYER
jgi:hypothetical protein